MGKLLRSFKIEHALEWEGVISINQLEEDIIKLKKLGVNSLEIKTYSSFDCAYLSIEAFKNRLETDKEYKDRVMNKV